MTDAPESIRPADPKKTLELSREVFGPALDAACRTAQGRGVTLIDVVNGMADAYFGTLVALIGEKGAIGLMKAHADHVAKLSGGQG